MNTRWIIAILYGVGFLGLMLYPTLFIPLSALSLCLTFMFLLLEEWSWKKLIFFCTIIVVGFYIEWRGVHTGSPFGFYQYGEGLGWKLWDIPVVIGVNWVIMTWSSLSLLRWAWGVNNRWILALGGGMLMTLTDLIIEQVAPQLEYWMFEMNHVPWNNYAAWMWLGVLFSWLLSYIPNKRPSLGAWVWVLNWMFFVGLMVVKLD